MITSDVDAESLLTLVDDDPGLVAERADSILADRGAAPRDRVVAQWARGTARRQLNALDGGESDLREARTAAVDLGDAELAGRIDVTLALVVFHTTSAEAALHVLKSARAHVRGADLARLESQEGLIHHRVGRLDVAQRAYERALARYGVADDPLGEIRLLNNLAILLSQRGRLDRSQEVAGRALALAERHGQRQMAAGALHNRGYVRGRAGRTADAWGDLRRAADGYAELGRDDLVHVARIDLADVLLGANLLDDALDVAQRAVDGLVQTGNPTDLADAWLLLARCQLASGHTQDALRSARTSAHLLKRQGRTSLLAYATFIRVFAASARRGELRPDELEELATQLRANGWWLESTVTRVLAVDKFVRGGDVDHAAQLLRAFDGLHSMPAAERSAVALARATVAHARGDLARTRRAVTDGLRMVADNQAGFTDLESRTLAAGHGAVLRDLGARVAIDAGRPRELLQRLESTRSGVLASPRPADGGALDGLLADLRAVAEELRAASTAGRMDGDLRRRQLELEREIREHARRVGQTVAHADDDIVSAIARLGERTLLEYALLGGRVWAVSVTGGRCALHDLGPGAGLADDIEACSFALHRLNRAGLSMASRDAAWATLVDVGGDLAARLVPPRLRVGDAPLVIVPDGVLHGVPWRAVLDPRRAVAVAPSLLGWAAGDRTARRRRRDARTVAVLGGPELPGARREIAAVAAVHASSRPRFSADCDGQGLIDAMSTVDLVHLACHGRFRADNPMFSTLSMHDGDVNVYDLQRCVRLPRTVVLSACSVGASSAVRGGTLLGLATALMSFGVANVIAPLTPVNDDALVDVMVGLHRRLAAGAPPAAALAATAAEPGTPAAAASAAFVALGA